MEKLKGWELKRKKQQQPNKGRPVVCVYYAYMYVRRVRFPRLDSWARAGQIKRKGRHWRQRGDSSSRLLMAKWAGIGLFWTLLAIHLKLPWSHVSLSLSVLYSSSLFYLFIFSLFFFFVTRLFSLFYAVWFTVPDRNQSIRSDSFFRSVKGPRCCRHALPVSIDLVSFLYIYIYISKRWVNCRHERVCPVSVSPHSEETAVVFLFFHKSLFQWPTI